MFPLEKCIESQLREIKGPTPTLIFPESDDPRIISGVSGLVQFAKIVLLNSRKNIEKMLDSQHVKLKVSRKRFLQSIVCFEPSEKKDLIEIFAKELEKKSKGRSWEIDFKTAKKMVRKPVYFSILSVRLGYADAVLGGLNHSSRDFFKPCLRLLERDGTVYEMGLFALPDSHISGIYEKNLVMFSDIALNPEPSPKRLADIAVGSCVTMRNMIPLSDLAQVNAALISYSTRGSGQGPSVDRIRLAEPMINARLKELGEKDPVYKTINAATELQIGCAISVQAARTKLGAEADLNPAMGSANLLILPSLDTGNLLYHIYSTRYPDSQKVLIIGGLRNQALDFSRTSTAEDLMIGAKALILRMYRSGRFKSTLNDDFFPRYKILTINPLECATEIALWNGRDLGDKELVKHSKKILSMSAIDQLPQRQKSVEDFMKKNNVNAKDMKAVVGRCGLLAPVASGTYFIDDKMINSLVAEQHGEHIANVGAILARRVAGKNHERVFVVDPPTTDERDSISQISGLKDYKTKIIWHALGQKFVAKHFAIQHGKEYENLNLIVAYLGSGVSVGAHLHGQCIKVNNSIYEGPMGLERAGHLSSYDVVELCFSGISKEDAIKQLTHESGFASYLGTSDFEDIQRRILNGDVLANTVFSAMIEEIAAEISSLIPKFMGAPVDQLILTGSLTLSTMLVERLSKILKALDLEITVYAGNLETEALRDAALRVLRGVETAKTYTG